MPEYTYNLNIWIIRLVNYVLYLINSICFSMLIAKRKLKLKETFIVIGLCTPLFIMSLYSFLLIPKFILEIIIYILIGKLLLKDKMWKVTLEAITIFLIINVYQIISLMFKSLNVRIVANNFVVDKLLLFDYYIMIVLTYLKASKRGGYIYARFRRFKLLVVLSNRRSRKESISKNQSVIHKESVESEKGYKLFVVMLSVFQFTLVGFLCYFINNVTWQYIVVFISFVVMRLCFGKSYHCNSVIACTTLSCVTFISATRLGLPPHISVLCNVLNGCLLAYLMYVLYYFFKYTTAQAITIQKGMSKDLLLIVCKENNLTEFETNILIEYYCNRNKLLWIANKYGYSEDRLKAIKRNILERISK